MDEEPKENLIMRGLWMLIIAMMIGFAQSVLAFVTLLQFILMVFNNRKPNTQLAWFGQSLGDWVAKAARFQTAASEEKPWPWTPLE